MRYLRKFAALHWSDRLLLAEACWELGLARCELLAKPFRKIAPGLGRQEPPSSEPLSAGAVPPSAPRIGWAVATMSRHTPWESACLAQAIAGKRMLSRRGIPSRLVLGTRKDTRGELAAHAWLRVEAVTILGEITGNDSFTPLAVFVG